MTTADQADQAPSIPTSRKVLCAVYGAIAVAALIATWSQTLAYSDKAAGGFLAFWNDVKVTPASRSLTADLLLFGLAAVIFMVTEARRHGVKFVWIYVAGGYLVAISVAFPLFLIARELRIGMSDAPHRHDPAGGRRHFDRWADYLDRSGVGLECSSRNRCHDGLNPFRYKGIEAILPA